MISVKIQHPSKTQLSKLRNGHTITIKKHMTGNGLNIVVDPTKYQVISKTFDKGRSMRLQLTPDEIVSSVLPTIAPSTEGEASVPSSSDAAAAADAPPSMMTGGMIGNMGPRNTLAPSTLHGAIQQNHLFDEMNKQFGRTYGINQRAHIGNVLASMSQGHVDKELVDAKHSGQFFGKGLYVGNPRNQQIMRYRSVRPPSMEGGTLGINSGFIHADPQALRSQPLSANFQFGSTLPVAYQQYSRGSGLFI